MASVDSQGSDDQVCYECWICLDGPGRNGTTLQSYCGCHMRVVHASCLIRWQLTQLERR